MPAGQSRDFVEAIWMHGNAPRARGTVQDTFELIAAAGEGGIEVEKQTVMRVRAAGDRMRAYARDRGPRMAAAWTTGSGADQMPACQVLGRPVRSRTSSMRRQASRASGWARRLRAIEFRNVSMI